MLAGIIVNIVLGVFIFWVLTIKYGETYMPNAKLKYGIVPGTVGQKIGLRPGDKITAINGKKVVRFEDLTGTQVILGNADLTVERGAQTLHVKVPTGLINEIGEVNVGIEQFISRSPRFKFAVDSVTAKSGAMQAGLQKGDSIVAVNSAKINFFDELQKNLQQNKSKEVQLSIERGGKLIQANAKISAEGTLGFYSSNDLPKEERLTYSFFGSLPVGATKAWGTFTDNAKGIVKMVKGEVKLNKAVVGPVGIATMFGSHVDWIRFWSLVGFLSMVLALTNLLPIPALDGGHSLFLIIEMIKGKPLSDKFLERAQIVGFVLLITLMVFVFGNDIVRQVMKK
jgi:regulator of sigma E protease